MNVYGVSDEAGAICHLSPSLYVTQLHAASQVTKMYENNNKKYQPPKHNNNKKLPPAPSIVFYIKTVPTSPVQSVVGETNTSKYVFGVDVNSPCRETRAKQGQKDTLGRMMANLGDTGRHLADGWQTHVAIKGQGLEVRDFQLVCPWLVTSTSRNTRIMLSFPLHVLNRADAG